MAEETAGAEGEEGGDGGGVYQYTERSHTCGGEEVKTTDTVGCNLKYTLCNLASHPINV